MSPANRLKRQLVNALRKHLQAGKAPNLPEAGVLAWGWFCDLSATRTYHMAGPHPISYAEIEAYARLHRIPMEPRHVETLIGMDRVWMEHAGGKGASKPIHPMSAAMFDAVFG